MADTPNGWDDLRAEVDAMNRWYETDGATRNSVSAWVGYWPVTGWYGGCGFDGDPMEEIADASGDTPDAVARDVARLMREYRERLDRERREDEDRG